MADADDFKFPFEPDQKAELVDLLFWKPSKLSDPEMEAHFPRLDGIWSTQTKDAMTRFDAKGVHLNEHWALTPPFWMCHACGRAKSDIFRVSKRGILLATLELHHDHVRDTVWKRVEERLGREWIREVAPRGSNYVLDFIRDITSRFDECLVCSDCNAADGSVKNKFEAQIDGRFTFTVSEIRQFVRPASPNKEHRINFQEALKIWNFERGGFDTRVQMIDELIDKLAAGHLSSQKDGSSRVIQYAFHAPSLLLAGFVRKTYRTPQAHLFDDLLNEFLARSVRHDIPSAHPSRKSANDVTAPTEEASNIYIDPVSTKRWLAAAEDWTCPICARQKRHIIRYGGAKKLTGGLREFYAYSEEKDDEAISNRTRLFPKFDNTVFVRACNAIDICLDCREISVRLCQFDRSLRDPYLSIQDLRDSLQSVRRGLRHELDMDFLRVKAIGNERYKFAIDAFFAFRGAAWDFARRFETGLRQGLKPEDMLKELSEDVSVLCKIDSEMECLELAAWLVDQGTTL